MVGSMLEQGTVIRIEGQREATMLERAGFIFGNVCEAHAMFLANLAAKGPEFAVAQATPVWEMDLQGIQANQVMCRELVLRGLSGDKSAQQAYADQRVFSMTTWPQWLIDHVANAFVDGYRSISQSAVENWIARSIKGGTHERDFGWRSPHPLSDYLAFFGLVQFPTPGCAQEFVAALEAQEYLYQDRMPLVCDRDDINKFTFITCYSPSEDSPFGRQARLQLKSLLRVAYNGLLLEDTLKVMQIELAPSAKIAILERASHLGWDFLKSKPGRNLMALSNEIAQSDCAPDAKTISELAAAGLFAKHGIRLQTSVASAPTNDANQLQHNYQELLANQRARIFAAVEERGGTGDSAQITRYLHALLKRGALSEQQVLHEIAHASSLQSLPAALHNRLYPRPQLGRHAGANMSVAEMMAGDEAASQAAREIRASINVIRTREFTAWLESLPESLKDAVERRIARVELGNFGDCVRLADSCLPNLFKLRLHLGAGVRVCIARTPVGYVFYYGYSKGNEARELPIAKRLGSTCLDFYKGHPAPYQPDARD